MKTYLLAAAMLLSLFSKAQTELTFNIGGQYVPVEFYRPYGGGREGSWPMLGASLGLQQEIGRSNFYWAAELSYQHARYAVDLIFPDEIDPFYGFVRNVSVGPDRVVEAYNYAGLNLGFGGRIDLQNPSKAILLPLKGKLLFPFASKRFYRSANGKSEGTPIYSDKYYSKVILCGLNFSPKYQFNFSGRRSDPWRFSAGLQAEYLIRNNSDGENYFLWGATLGVSYQLPD